MDDVHVCEQLKSVISSVCMPAVRMDDQFCIHASG